MVYIYISMIAQNKQVDYTLFINEGNNIGVDP